MSLERWFHLSQYLTLGMSCAALVLAEAPFFPDLQFCLAPVLALLLLAWWVEGRWGLPNWVANFLGLLIAAGGATWLVRQRSNDNFVLAHLPLHLALLPSMGPLSMAALLVKVFRRRDAYHFWHLQGWGLMQIALGCLLDGGPAFGVLMAAYLASDLVCLALHYRLSTLRGAEPRLRQSDWESHLSLANPSLEICNPKWLLSFTLRWTLLISALALLLFLATPRRGSWSWQPLNRLYSGNGQGRIQDVNEEMNLNNVGRIELDDTAAFHVFAEDANGRPKLDLPSDQRWRSSVLDWYDHGKWTMMYLMPIRSSRRYQRSLPHFGPDQFFLTFTVQPQQAGGLVLAEPIRFGPNQNKRLPVVVLTGDRYFLFTELSGTVLPQVYADLQGVLRYRQVVPGNSDADRIPAEDLWLERELDVLVGLPRSLHTPLQRWTVDLLRRLSEQARYHLSADVRAALAKPPRLYQIPPYHWEAVARALTDYLAHSGEYTYTLELTRQDHSIDPVLDFLFNVKRGHCERYAAALALMLRSVGIPARVVKGFRGCENHGDGHYVVRHSHAHAWVETLVLRPPLTKGPNALPLEKLSFDWVTLDATPAEPTPVASRFPLTYFWEKVRDFSLQWWRVLIVEYNSDEQADLWDLLTSVQTWSLLGKLGLAFLAIGVIFAGWLSLRRRSPATICGDYAIYPRLVRILTRYVALRPHCGQTPREYGAAAQTLLQARPTLAALAELPLRVVELFYRTRFGGRPLNEGERRQIDAELGLLKEELRKRSRPRCC
jgi:transglutaminase-like putative cysteine protease